MMKVRKQSGGEGMFLTMLGTGNGFTPGLMDSNALLESGQGRTLIDCGTTAWESLGMLGMKRESVDTIFLTHIHFDHAGGLESIALYSKYVSRVFSTKEEAMEDKTVTDMICCRCRRMLRKKLKWFSLNQKQYFCLAWCPEHGYVRGKIRMKKAEPDGFYVVKTMKQVEESGADEVFARKEEQRKKRKVRRGSHQRR